jgi:ABC-type dipeptide/oligopeptide/nickel transport system ATPase component
MKCELVHTRQNCHRSREIAVFCEFCRRRRSEQGATVTIFGSLLDPYTRALVASMPSVEYRRERAARRETPLANGELPSPLSPPSGSALNPLPTSGFAVAQFAARPPDRRTRTDGSRWSFRSSRSIRRQPI